MPKQMLDTQRSFQVEEAMPGFEGSQVGRYIAETPRVAARKAARQLFLRAGRGGGGAAAGVAEVWMVLRDTTRNSPHHGKLYYFLGSRQSVSAGTARNAGDKSDIMRRYNVQFVYHVTSITEDDYKARRKQDMS